jgi:hypothetical protein
MSTENIPGIAGEIRTGSHIALLRCYASHIAKAMDGVAALLNDADYTSDASKHALSMVESVLSDMIDHASSLLAVIRAALKKEVR